MLTSWGMQHNFYASTIPRRWYIPCSPPEVCNTISVQVQFPEGGTFHAVLWDIQYNFCASTILRRWYIPCSPPEIPNTISMQVQFQEDGTFHAHLLRYATQFLCMYNSQKVVHSMLTFWDVQHNFCASTIPRRWYIPCSPPEISNVTSVHVWKEILL
jgi:hypothetical protein